MRGLTREALQRIDLQSQSWEYASEMVLKAARLGLRIGEVPVKFYKDREGRLSHHRRAGWLSPWIAGWINLKVMLVYSPDSFLLKPGFVLAGFGLLLAILLGTGPVTIAGIGFNLHWMLLGMTCATLGYSCIQIGVTARIIHRLRPGFCRDSVENSHLRPGECCWRERFLGWAWCSVGTLAWHYVAHGWRLVNISHPAILGLLLLILGFQTFCFTLLLEMTPSGHANESPMSQRAHAKLRTAWDDLGSIVLGSGFRSGPSGAALPRGEGLVVLELGLRLSRNPAPRSREAPEKGRAWISRSPRR
ncbi:MAG: hypothetical protein WDN28_25595 [Chthoniobacter sp.]